MTTDDFLRTLNRSGYLVDVIIPDGQIHRMSTRDKPASKSGWYAYHKGRYPFAVYGDWRTGEKKFQKGYDSSHLPGNERRELRATLRDIARQKDQEQQKIYTQSAQKAKAVWNKAQPLRESYQYLCNKKVKNHGLRFYKGRALIPILDIQTNYLLSLQFIDKKGTKRFLSGGRTKGGYYPIGTPGNRIYVCEGYATGATIHELTGAYVVVAFNAGNLAKIASGLARRYPESALCILADNDRFNERNVGVTKAIMAAKSVGCNYLVPTFPANSSRGTDFNDLFIEMGRDEVKRQLEDHHSTDEEPDRESESYDYKPFPIDLLPAPIHHYAQAQAAALDVSPALVALPTLSILSAAVGNTAQIELKRSWRETSTLWTVSVAPSGTGKSPALSAVLKPIYDLEKQALEQYQKDKKHYEEDLSQWNDATKDQKKKIPKPVEPTFTRYRIADTTVEALIARHVDNPRGLLVARDELSGLLGSFDRYAKGESDMQSFIEMYEGRPISVDRKSSDTKVLSINKPNVSITGTIQPGLLQSKLTQAHFQSGFFARFLVCAPPSKQSGWTDADVSEEIEARFIRFIRSLYELPLHEEPMILTPEAEAKQLFKEFMNQSAVLRESFPDGPLRSSMVKMDAICARLALILHVADYGIEVPTISAPTMERAIKITKWLRYEMIRVWKELDFDKRALSKEQQILEEVPDQFTSQLVSETLGKGKRQAQRIIKSLIAKRLVKEIKRGVYEKNDAMSHVANDVNDALHLSKSHQTTQTTCDTTTFHELAHGSNQCEYSHEDQVLENFNDDVPF